MLQVFLRLKKVLGNALYNLWMGFLSQN